MPDKDEYQASDRPLIGLYIVTMLFLLAFGGLLLFTGCDQQVTITGLESAAIEPDDYRVLPDDPKAKPPYKRIPPAEIPEPDREHNYGGSCNHASFISVLRYFGRDKIADQWRARYGGAAGVYDIARVADRFDLDYCMTAHEQKSEFLEWCSRTNRPAGIHYFPAHAVTFAGYSQDGDAILIDNNSPAQYIHIPKEKFIRNWIYYGSCAITLADPAPPARPWVYRPDEAKPRSTYTAFVMQKLAERQKR